MSVCDGNRVTSCAGEGLSGFQRYWPHDEGASGYGVAVYIGTALITCRLFNLETNELLDTQRIEGDFEPLTTRELSDVLNNLFVLLAEASGVKLSKLTSAVISGTTAMECKAAGIDLAEQLDSADNAPQLLGYDIEYLMAGPSSIAVGEAYYAPCLSREVGGDFLCSLLAIDILQREDHLVFVNMGPDSQSSSVIAFGNRESLSVSVVPHGSTEDQAILALLDACGAQASNVAHLLHTGNTEPAIPRELHDRAHKVDNAAIEGASAILLSGMAEDQLIRIVDACRIVAL